MTLAAVRPSPLASLGMGIAVAAGLSLIVAAIGEAAVLEAWLVGFVLLVGLGGGAVGLLLVGHLLGEVWLKPIRAELEAIAYLMPMVAVLAAPILLRPAVLYPWAGEGRGPDVLDSWLDPWPFTARSIAYLAVLIALATIAARAHRLASGFAIAVLVPAISIAAFDWLASREPDWIPGLYGPAFAISQLVAAMSLALLVTVIRPGHPPMARAESLRIALLSLALLTLWTWYSQFLVVWMADLPAESAWYLRRSEAWLVAEVATAAPALLAAVVLLLPPEGSAWRVGSAAALLLVQHVAHMAWLIRPAATGATSLLADLVIIPGMIAIWAVFFAVEVRRRPNLGIESDLDEIESQSR